MDLSSIATAISGCIVCCVLVRLRLVADKYVDVLLYTSWFWLQAVCFLGDAIQAEAEYGDGEYRLVHPPISLEFTISYSDR